MAKKILTYDAAIKRLELIVQGLEENTLELEQLTIRIAEAKELIHFCNERLQKIESEVNNADEDGEE